MVGSKSSGNNVIKKTMEPDRHVTPTRGHLELPILAKERTNRIVHSNFSFTLPLICLLPVSPQHEKAEVLLSSTPTHPKHHCSIWRYPHFARLSFYKEKFWDEDVYGSLRWRCVRIIGGMIPTAEECSNSRNTCPSVVLSTAKSTLKFVKYVKIQFVPHRKRYVSLLKTNRLKVFTAGTVQNKNKPCGQNAGFLGKASPLCLNMLVDKTNVNEVWTQLDVQVCTGYVT
jgi:hypothetical protein